jgi:hypothetical protein
MTEYEGIEMINVSHYRNLFQNFLFGTVENYEMLNL